MDKIFTLVDGENLILRYQALVKAGKSPRTDVIHEKDLYVWAPRITQLFCGDYCRVTFYQTVSGDVQKFEKTAEEISSITYAAAREPGRLDLTGSLNPRLFHKQTKASKTKSVDINITIDALRHAYLGSADIIFLLSGDGDYVP